MVLLLLGTAISAVLIPYISGTISDRKLLQDERSKQALTIIEESGLVDKHLETLQTTCEMFTKDTHGERKEIVEAQRQLKKDLDEQYRTFNEHAWFWHRTLELRSILLKVPDKDRAVMRELLEQYRQNLVDSTKALDPVWASLLSKGYKADDPRTKPLLDTSRHNLVALGAERDALAGKLAILFFNSRGS